MIIVIIAYNMFRDGAVQPARPAPSEDGGAPAALSTSPHDNIEIP